MFDTEETTPTSIKNKRKEKKRKKKQGKVYKNIMEKYNIIVELGRGAFGIVRKA